MREYRNNIFQKEINFLDCVDSWFLIHGEVRESKGEDSYVYIIKDKMGLIAVFDGCGGSGARLYPSYGNKTGAYVASRILAQATGQWFDTLDQINDSGDENWSLSLKGKIDNLLNIYKESGSRESTLRGKLIKEFPSTLSAAVIRTEGDRLMVNYFWSGDSRGYLMNSSGLHQVTVDDLSSRCDAMENLYMDSPMSNVVSASEAYLIHENKVNISFPSLIVTATDGCFGYLKSPIEFERVLLDNLMKSYSMDEWKNNIQKVFQIISGDDHTMCLLALGFGTFENIKDYFSQRLLYLNDRYPHTDHTDELVNQWEHYRIEYEQYMK